KTNKCKPRSWQACSNSAANSEPPSTCRARMGIDSCRQYANLMTGGLAGDTSAGVTAVGLEGVLTKFPIGRQQRTFTSRRVGGLRVLLQQDPHFTTGLFQQSHVRM